ncbi:MAG: hypothetical protein MJ067_06645, partial [Oscillospiraceae bacterium]|nr:hypothetical protein [Oscillospiraceae bacterium]
EIRRLDEKTGLDGAKVTVRLYPEREPMGCFTFIDPVRMTFGFSKTRFEEAGFTDAEALDIIRHEYAHFMEYRLYGFSSDHGPCWQDCCRKIGARPEKMYTEEFKQSARQKERERVQKTRVDGFKEGSKVSHPKFGEGTVEKIDRMQNITILTIRFGESVKRLDIDWVRKNCKGK